MDRESMTSCALHVRHDCVLILQRFVESGGQTDIPHTNRQPEWTFQITNHKANYQDNVRHKNIHMFQPIIFFDVK